MDRVEKALLKFPKKRRSEILNLLRRIRRGDVTGLDIVKLSGYPDWFRIRKGSNRIIARKVGNRYEAIILENRSETTYRQLGRFDH